MMSIGDWFTFYEGIPIVLSGGIEFVQKNGVDLPTGGSIMVSELTWMAFPDFPRFPVSVFLHVVVLYKEDHGTNKVLR
jgi:hypothetical protein